MTALMSTVHIQSADPSLPLVCAFITILMHNQITALQIPNTNTEQGKSSPSLPIWDTAWNSVLELEIEF